MGMPLWGVTHTFGLSRTPEQTNTSELRHPHTSYLSFPHSSSFSAAQNSAMLEFLITTNSLPLCRLQTVGCWLLTATCSLGSTRATLSFNSTSMLCRSYHQVLPNANFGTSYIIQSFISLRDDSLSVQLQQISITCKLQLGRITCFYKYQAGWWECSGTPSFAHYQRIL